MRAADVFATGTLEKIARVTNAVAAIPGVERVLSLTNAPDPAADVLSQVMVATHHLDGRSGRHTVEALHHAGGEKRLEDLYCEKRPG